MPIEPVNPLADSLDDINAQLPSKLSLVTGIERSVCVDIETRQQLGIAKYGMTVEANNAPLREWLMHAYQETLDKAIYLRRAIAEIDRSPSYTVVASRYLAGEVQLEACEQGSNGQPAAGDVVRLIKR